MDVQDLLRHLPDIIKQVQRSRPCEVEKRHFEVKGWCRDEKELWKEVTDAAVCLANADGGIILVGLKDDLILDQALPCPHTKVNANWLSECIRKYTHPPIECAVFPLRQKMPEISGVAGDCLVAVVPKKSILGVHRTHRGVCLIRHENACDIDHLSAEDDYSSILIDCATLEDLSKESLNWAFGNRTVRPRQHLRWQGFKRSPDDLLRDFNLIRNQDGIAISLAAILLFGKKEFLARHTDSAFLRITWIDKATAGINPYTTLVTQNISDTLRDIWTRQGSLFAQLPADDLPETCLRELIVNALIHRSYCADGPINIRVTPGHLFEIQNAGGFLRNLTPDNLINASPVHRNRLLTEAAALLGFCEKSGSGIDMVYQEAAATGHDFPYFAGDSEAFSAMVPLARDTNFATFIRYHGKDFAKLESLLIVRYLHSVGRADASKLSRIIQRPLQFSENLLRDMVKRLILIEDQSLYLLSDNVRREIESPREPHPGQGTLFSVLG